MAGKPSGRAKRITVVFLYGAADRNGMADVKDLRGNLLDVGIDIGHPVVVDWGSKYGVNPSSADIQALVEKRFGDTDADAKALIDRAIIAQLGSGFLSSALASHIDETLIKGVTSAVTGAFPVIVDAFSYEKRSSEIIAFVNGELDKVASTSKYPVVVIGISLGGIIAVDSLSDPSVPAGSRKAIRLLVTIGSQSPALLACDALQFLRRTHDGPTPFFPWLNVWRRLDFLSFPATQLFGTQTTTDLDLRDVDIDDPKAPTLFPTSHTTYFTDRRLGAAIRQMLVDLRVMEPGRGVKRAKAPAVAPQLEARTREVDEMLAARPKPKVAGWPRAEDGIYYLRPR